MCKKPITKSRYCFSNELSDLQQFSNCIVLRFQFKITYLFSFYKFKMILRIFQYEPRLKPKEMDNYVLNNHKAGHGR